MTGNLIMRVSVFYHMKLTQSTSQEQERFDSQSEAEVRSTP